MFLANIEKIVSLNPDAGIVSSRLAEHADQFYMYVKLNLKKKV